MASASRCMGCLQLPTAAYRAELRAAAGLATVSSTRWARPPARWWSARAPAMRWGRAWSRARATTPACLCRDLTGQRGRVRLPVTPPSNGPSCRRGWAGPGVSLLHLHLARLRHGACCPASSHSAASTCEWVMAPLRMGQGGDWAPRPARSTPSGRLPRLQQQCGEHQRVGDGAAADGTGWATWRSASLSLDSVRAPATPPATAQRAPASG